MLLLLLQLQLWRFGEVCPLLRGEGGSCGVLGRKLLNGCRSTTFTHDRKGIRVLSLKAINLVVVKVITIMAHLLLLYHRINIHQEQKKTYIQLTLASTLVFRFFVCSCPRCLSSNELGSHLSSLRCPKCEDGFMTQRDPKDSTSPWACTTHSFTLNRWTIGSYNVLVTKELNLS